MTVKDVVAELKKFGNAQTKKTWMIHGAKEPCFGVKVEDLKKIQKRVKMDYQLALDLYDTGIADAMYLAGLIAVDTGTGIGKIAVAADGHCGTIPFAPERIKKFEARSPIGKKRKSPKC